MTDAFVAFEPLRGWMLSCIFVPSSGDQSAWSSGVRASRTYEDEINAIQTDAMRIHVDFRKEQREAEPSES